MNFNMNLLFSMTWVMITGVVAQAQQQPDPQNEHRWLQRFVGAWETETTGKMAPDQPPMNCTGTISSRMVGEFWVINDIKTNVMNMSVRALQTVGYDAAKKKYVGTWIDSMSGFMWQYEGKVDERATTLVLTAKGPSLAGDEKMAMFHDVCQFKSADEMTAHSKMLGEDGEWIAFMNGTAKHKP